MRKLFLTLLVTFITLSQVYAYDIEEVAGAEEYEINMGLKNFVADSYGDFKMSLLLPVAEQIKIGFVTEIGLNMTDYTYKKDIIDGDSGVSESQKWDKINTDFEFYLGLNMIENVGISIMFGGGSVFDKYEMSKNSFTKTDTEIISGYGFGKLGLGVLLGSELFNGALSSLKIRQFLTLAGGNGGKEGSTNITIVDGKKTGVENTFFAVEYSGLIGFGIPFEVGLPKFELGLELDYGIAHLTYLDMKVITNDTVADAVYSTLPNFTEGDASLKFNLGINPAEHLENNFWVKPGFKVESKNSTVKDLKKVEGGVIETGVAVGSDWKATFAKIVWLKLSAEWQFKFAQNFSNNENAGFKWDTTSGKFTSTSHLIDGGLTLGFNFEGWNAEFEWAPGYVVGSDSNVWNLANWKFSVSCKFPALYK